MYSIIESMISYTQSNQYMSTYEQAIIYSCCALCVLFSILMIDWVRKLFATLINKLR